MVNCCGLLSVKKEPVPLKSIDVVVEVKDHVAAVSSTLLYENQEQNPIEAVFVFPLPGDAAVCHFSAKIGETEVLGEVQEKEKAREMYDDALSSGQQAFLLEESEQSPDIFSMNVGNLPPGESASIRLEYVIELAVQADDGLRFCLPAVLNPRYQPQGSEGSSVQVTSMPASLVPYSLAFSARVFSPRPILKIESTCSLDPLQYLNAEQTQATVRLAAGHKFDRDVEMLLYYKDAHLPTAVVEAGQASAKPGSLMGDPVVMLSLYPEFPSDVLSSVASCGEFVFLIDRSGSMTCAISSGGTGQTRIDSARDTLLLLLKSLPVGCYFNIYSFGSNFDHIFPKSVEYSQESVDKALKQVELMKADMGGTEILQPLSDIFSQPCIPSQPRQLFIFTDGEVGNTKEVIDLVKKNCASHRCFSFGIGEGASSALITGLAKEGKGHAQFITGTERMQPKVMQSLRFSLQPAVQDISVTWDVPKGVSVTPLSPPVTALFSGHRALVYAQLTGESAEATEGCVTARYILAGQLSQNQLNFCLRPTEDTGLTFHRLGARSLIRSLESEEREGKKEKVVEVSVQSGVSSSFTAFVAVNKGNKEAIKGPLVSRHVPAPRMQAMYSCMPMARMACAPMPQRAKRAAKSHGVQIKSFGWFSNPRAKKSSKSDRMKMTCSMGDSLGYQMDCGNIEIAQETDSGISVDEQSEAIEPPRDTMLQLISLQRASGSWVLEPALATVMGKTVEEVTKPKPAMANTEVWATVVALIWLHAFKMEATMEWQLLAMKAVSWLKAQKAPSIAECVEAGNVLLGCKVQKDALGL